MAALNIHLNELLAILLASEGVPLQNMTAVQVRDAIAERLAGLNPELASRMHRLDDWQTDAVAEFVADAHALSQSWKAVTLTDAPEQGETKHG
jgi:hypothetical protein